MTLMYPAGCLSNIQPVVNAFMAATGVKINLFEVALDQINDELLAEAPAAEAGQFRVPPILGEAP